MFEEPLAAGDDDRITRAKLAIILHKLPTEIDAMPITDYADVWDVYIADEQLRRRALKLGQ
jgi:hypothetical protein